MKLHISPDFSLPLNAVTQTFAILAKRRAGKSYTARKFAEELLTANQQVVIVDPKGDWWGIRSAADGKSPGFGVIILGGEHGDLPLEVASGELVAKLVVEERASILLDLSSMRKGEVAEFMGGPFGLRGRSGFLEALYRMKAREEFRAPVMLIVDEADAIAPQRPFKGEERMLGAIEDIVRRGGQRGIGCILVSQRSAVLNKNVLTQTQMLVAMRTIAPQDLAAVNEWVNVHGTDEERRVLMGSLPSLPTGTAWFWSPGWPSERGIFQNVQITRIKTFDSGATPKPGEKRVTPKNLADIDIDVLKHQMAETMERFKADDPRELRKRIAELEKQGKQAPASFDPGPLHTENAELRRAYEALDSRYRADLAKMKLIRELLDPIPQRLQNAFLELEQLWQAGREAKPLPAARPVQHAPVSTAPKPLASRRDHVMPSNGILGTPQRRILTVLAQRPDGVELDRLAILAGYTVNGHFNNMLGNLRTEGLVTRPRVSPIQITQEGLTKLGAFEPLPTGKDLQGYWVSRLSGPESRILRTLLDAYPDEVTLEELAMRSGYTINGHFNNMIRSLRTKGLMTPPRTPIRAAKEFFL